MVLVVWVSNGSFTHAIATIQPTQGLTGNARKTIKIDHVKDGQGPVWVAQKGIEIGPTSWYIILGVEILHASDARGRRRVNIASVNSSRVHFRILPRTSCEDEIAIWHKYHRDSSTVGGQHA